MEKNVGSEHDIKRLKKELEDAKDEITDLEMKLKPTNDMIEKLQKVIVRLLPKGIPYFGEYNINNPTMMSGKMKGIRHIIRLMFTYGLIPRLPPEDVELIPHDFFEITFMAMEELMQRNHPNIVYKLSAAICMKKADGTPALDVDRMPYVMLEGKDSTFLGPAMLAS